MDVLLCIFARTVDLKEMMIAETLETFSARHGSLQPYKFVLQICIFRQLRHVCRFTYSVVPNKNRETAIIFNFLKRSTNVQ